jgi:hypothetical protein
MSSEPQKSQAFSRSLFSAEELMPDRISVEVGLPDGTLLRFSGKVQPCSKL